MTNRLLVIKDLDTRHYAIIKSIGDYFYDAASVCLNRHHKSPTVISIENDNSISKAEITWGKVDQRMLDAFADENEATEMGACACSIAAIELELGLFVLRRANKPFGCDYYIGPAGTTADDLEDLYRLEISGMNAGTSKDLTKRLKTKIRQTIKGRSNLPAIACVVGFQPAKILIHFVRL